MLTAHHTVSYRINMWLCEMEKARKTEKILYLHTHCHICIHAEYMRIFVDEASQPRSIVVI